jgi:phosphoglycolate phosphatase-like HAD superfamily hydrolase
VEYERELVIRTAGALPVVAKLADRLGLVEAVDRFCPIRSVADYTHGQVLLALVANRLTHPRPLSSFEDWGEDFAVAETLGIAACKLNDDRLGRTLDALAERLPEVLNLVARRAIERFGISLAELHWDLTHLAFTGSYEAQEERYPRVRKGRTPAQTIVRQVRTGLLVSEDGAVPLLAESFDGNREDTTSVEPALARLDALRGALPAERPPLVVGDSKLLSAANVRAFEQRGLRFLCPHRKDAPMKRRLAALEEERLEPLAYRPERHKQGPPRYLACAQELALAGSMLRALFVLSLDDRDAARAQRERQLARAGEELDKLNHGVPAYGRSAEEVERRARAILERRRVDPLVRLTVGERDGYPQALLEPDPDAIAAAERLDGRYCLVSNDDTLSADELFAAYKRQHLVEGRFADFKGPLAVRPVFLHSNRRIAALVGVISLALLLYGLVERTVRRGLATLGADERRLLQRRIGRATGRKIFDQLRTLTAVRVRDGPTRLAQPRPAQQLLLRLLET